MKKCFILMFLSIGIIIIGNAQTGAWYQMTDAPATLKRGCAISCSSGDTLYTLRGYSDNSFYAYVISQNTWITRSPVPVDIDTGGALSQIRNCSLYAFSGKNSANFFLYRTSQNQWTQKANAPGVILPGAALCWTGYDTVYAFKGGQTQTFYKYIISTNTWITASNLPQIANYGASMCWTGENSKFYAVFGGNSNKLFLYNSQSNPPWIEMASPGVGWQQGASLIWNGVSTIYAIVGGGSTTILAYNIITNTWGSITSPPDGIGGSKEGAGLLAWDYRSSQKQLYLIRGDGSKILYRYCLPLSENFPMTQGFEQVQFPPAGWQSKLEQGTDIIQHNWQRLTSGFTTPPYPNTAIAGHIPSSNTRRRAKLVTPKLYIGSQPALVKVSFYMFYSQLGTYDDTLLIEYYKIPSYSNPTIATFNRKDPSVSGWVRREVMFVETDSIMVSFHCINREGDAHLWFDSIHISIDDTKLYSNIHLATAVNSSRLLSRKPGNERLHLIFRNATYEASGQPQSQGFLYYSYSDGGDIWSSPILIDTVYHTGDLASNATITTGVFDNHQPWIVYVKSIGSLWASIQRTDGTWKKMSIYSTGGFVHEPSMAMGLTVGPSPDRIPDLAYVVFRHRPSTQLHRVRFFAFDTTGQKYAEQELDATPSPDPCGQPSIAITPQDFIHIAYLRYESGQNRIYYLTLQNPTNNYQTRTSGIGSWRPGFRVSYHLEYPYLEPATYPSVEAYGQSVFVAWRGKNIIGQDIGEIWRRERNIPLNIWYDPENKSMSSSRESHYPVMGTSMVTVFQESTAARNKEIYANIINEIINISQTDSFSFFPQINVEEPPPPTAPYELKVNTIWTERLSNYAYQIKFRKYSYVPSLDLSYYSISTGDSAQSPMCLARDSFVRYPQLPIDLGFQKISYELPYLHPSYYYNIKATAYQRNAGRFRQNIILDSLQVGLVEYDPNIAETIDIEIPKSIYQLDRRAILEIIKNRGQFVTLANPLLVYQYEIPDTTSGSGTQTTNQSVTLSRPKLFQNYPNPFKTHTTIRYSIPIENRVSLKIYNINGTLIKTLINQPQKFGVYSVNWDGKNNDNKTVSSGIYFYRLETDNYQTTNRAIIIR